jgi:hypothetical protein
MLSDSGLALGAASTADIAKLVGAFAGLVGALWAVVKGLIEFGRWRRRKEEERKALDTIAEQIGDVLAPTAGVAAPLVAAAAAGPLGVLVVVNALLHERLGHPQASSIESTAMPSHAKVQLVEQQ